MQRVEIPSSVAQRAGSDEIVSIWTNGEVNDFVIGSLKWNDPAAWGLLLVDLARHVSKFYAANGQDEVSALARIKAGLDAEWGSPTEDLHSR